MSEQQQLQSPLDLHKVPNETYFAVMQAIELYLEAQQELAAALKAGQFDLAKAKYSLGPGSVGQQCYPGEMQAAVTVLRQPPVQQQDSLFDHFELRQQLEQCHTAAAKEPQQQLAAKAGAVADATTACKQQDDTVIATDSKHIYSSSSSTSSHSHDPLAWFSALPPPTLRSAQVQFKSALERAVAAANRVQELRHLLDELLETCSLKNHTNKAAAAAAESVAAAEC